MSNSNSSNSIKYKSYILGLNRVHFICGNWRIMHTVWRNSIQTLWLTLKDKFDAVTSFSSSRQKFKRLHVKYRKKNVFNQVCSFNTNVCTVHTRRLTSQVKGARNFTVGPAQFFKCLPKSTILIHSYIL